MTRSHCTQVTADSSEYSCMRIVVGVVSVLVLMACGPSYGADVDSDPDQFSDDPRVAAEIAAEIYETEHGALSATCMADARTAEFTPMGDSELGVQCNTAYRAADACFYQYDVHGAKMAIAADKQDNKQLRVHELLHMMLQCAANDWRASDSQHRDEVWLHLDEPRNWGQSAARRE